VATADRRSASTVGVVGLGTVAEQSTAAAAAALPVKIPGRAFVPFVVAGTVLAGAYGTTFLLADHLRALGHTASSAGAVVSVGTVATIASALVAGRLAERVGLMLMLAMSALTLAAAMICFALIGTHMEIAYLGGLLLGIGWSVFYILAPVEVIHHVQPAARIKYLTLLSGAQMFGLGSAPLIGRAVEAQVGSLAPLYVGFAATCAAAALIMIIAQRALRDQPQLPMTAMALTGALVTQIVRARTALPVAMIGLAACVFAGLSTFQTLYADSRGLSPATFFLVFTLTTVGLRFSVAPLIGRVALGRLVLAVFVATLAALVLLRANEGSLVSLRAWSSDLRRGLRPDLLGAQQHGRQHGRRSRAADLGLPRRYSRCPTSSESSASRTSVAPSSSAAASTPPFP